MLKGITNFLITCPQLNDIKAGFCDYKNRSAAVFLGETKTVSSYIDGGRLKKLEFKIILRSAYGEADVLSGINRCNAVARWLREKSRAGQLPSFEDANIIAQYFEIENDPVCNENTASLGEYTLNCYLIYYEKGDDSFGRNS